MACDCITTMNGRLADHNGQLVTTLFGTPKAVIGSEKIDSKKRGQPPVAIASFCPFCGAAYDAAIPPASKVVGVSVEPMRPATPEDGQTPSTPEDGRAVHTC